jgi:PAS domain S-box-containing protein
MNTLFLSDVDGKSVPLEVVWQGVDRNFCRLVRGGSEGDRHVFVPSHSSAGHPTPESVKRLVREFELKDFLDKSWALQPVELVRERGHTLLFVEYANGEPLDRHTHQPMAIGKFLRVALALTTAVGRLHGRGLIHKDIKPSNVIANLQTDEVWLTGFGIASRLPRERQAPEPPEFIAGTLAYMAPEQTGRVNRSIDSRSDLYSLGVTLFEMLYGCLPFSATDPMDWVHCHIARQPVVPIDRAQEIPATVAAITMKLLSKTVEERYQTAAGVESDLRRCLSEWESLGCIADFQPGQHDVPDRLLIPERLYGRDREVATLLTAFDRIVAGCRPEMVLVSGYSGIGKSAVVNELHKPLVPPRGLFASGKFDQYKRDIPYATLAQAFQSLVRPLLSRNEDELRRWRELLLEALEPNAQLIVELVPELKHIIGEQPPVPELQPQEAQRRFQLMFRRFIAVFARPEHPLALFLDDLQWLDPATLDLIEDLLTRSDLQHLLLIGAYRDNEVSTTHPLMRKLEAIRNAGGTFRDIVLTPLQRDDLEQMLADSLHGDCQRVAPLAQLIHEKTTGNPFFAIQFISALADEGLLNYEHREGRWAWDLGRIHAKGFTENVVELMVGKLNRLPAHAQRALQQFACMGNTATFEMLQMVHQESTEQLHENLWDAVRSGLIFRSEDSYRFLHDRVQEAAYSLIPRSERAEAHLRIGTLLARHTPPARREDAIFEIVNQLNRGSHLIVAVEERERVADLNLIAGRRAKYSTAYASALKYLRAARVLLSEQTWQRNYALIFAIEYLTAECELLTADLVAAEDRLSNLAQRAANRHDFCVTTRLRLTLYTTLDRNDRAAEVFVEWLSRDGTVWSVHPTRDDVMREYQRIWTLLGDRRIEQLIDLPLITDQDTLDTMDVITEIVTPALMFDEQLSTLVVCRLVTLSLEHGNCDGSCFGYVWLAMFAGPRFGNYKDAFKFGQVGYELVEKRGLTRYQARTYMNIGCTVLPWVRHVVSGRDLIRRAFDAAYRVGDLTFASYSWDQIVTNYLAVGDPLGETQAECEKGLAFARRHGFGLVIHLCGAQMGMIRSMRGLTHTFGLMDYEGYTETDIEREFADNANLALAEFFYLARKMQSRLFARDIASAVAASLRADKLAWSSTAQFETAEHQLFGALAHGQAWNDAPVDRKPFHLDALRGHHRQLETWAENGPETFGNRAAIAAAEIARIEGRVLDAQELYEKAIRLSHEHGFVHHEALSNELAGYFYLARGLERIATAYLREARLGYSRWGADAKVRQLDQHHPGLGADPGAPDATSTFQTPVDQLDLATVIRVSEAISGEIVFEKLIDTLLRTAIEHAGAERGLLIIPHGDDQWIEAEAITGSDQVSVNLRHARVGATDLPVAVFRFALRTREMVLLQDASMQGEFAGDEYIRTHRAKSVLCLPLLKQARLLGMLYLENNLASHAFTPARMSSLKLLASAAAMSMENARLYRDLAERESRIRRLVDANIIGIFFWDFQGRILEANEAFLSMLGYDREDLLTADVRWTDMTPPEWRERDEQRWVPQLKVDGSLQPFEKEFFRKDGTRVPVLIGAASLEEGSGQGVAFVLDLTERKRSADALRTLQMELAHANRLATMGQFAASIAHEVNQPIGAARNNAHAALRFLAARPPDLEEIREALDSVVSETYRASDIIGGIRDQVKKVPPRMEGLDLNEAIREVVALVRGELGKQNVSIHTSLSDSLPNAHGDRVQLQQVILNLILNAMEAMSGNLRSRELTIITSVDGSGELLVAVCDSGPGVLPADSERVFESFYSTKADGMGIGLSICRSIIDAHSGRLWVDPNHPRGAAFRFTLPVHRPS